MAGLAICSRRSFVDAARCAWPCGFSIPSFHSDKTNNENHRQSAVGMWQPLDWMPTQSLSYMKIARELQLKQSDAFHVLLHSDLFFPRKFPRTSFSNFLCTICSCVSMSKSVVVFAIVCVGKSKYLIFTM